jgi:hypothetical protein
MRWAEYVAQMREKENARMLFVAKPGGKRQLGRQRCRWVIILSWILEKYGWVEPSGCIKCREILGWLHNWWPLEWCSAP